MVKKYPLLIKKHKTGSDYKYVVSPFNNKPIAKVPVCDETQALDAIETAHNVFLNKKNWLSLAKRLEIFDKLIPLMQARYADLAKIAASEGGKPLTDSIVEAKRAIEGIKTCISTMRTLHGRVIPMNLSPASANRYAFTKHEPIGVVLAFSAFNHPLNLIIHQVATAIAAGCPVVVKPASNTPLSCHNFVELLYEAGLPEEFAQVVVTKDHEVALEMVQDERVAFFSFIGSADVGWDLRRKLPAGCRCALEHGGIAPVIVEPDTDMDLAISKIAKGGFYHAGQVCVSVQRVYAHKTIARDLSHKLAQIAEEMVVGDPLDSKTEVGPIIKISEIERIHKWVNEALSQGGDLVAGGKVLDESLYSPTVIYNPPKNAAVSTKEIFGPVICIYEYDDINDAINWANSVPFAFQSAVFTKDINRAMYAFNNLNGSAIMINEHTAFREDGMPFAGLKHSGLGVGGIIGSMHDMQIEKMMVLHSPNIV